MHSRSMKGRSLSCLALLINLFPTSTLATSNINLTPIQTLLLLDDPETIVVNALEWQQSDDGQLYSQADAETYCENLELAGKNDWRLPEKDEIKGLVFCSNDQITLLNDYPIEPYSCRQLSGDFQSPTINAKFSSRKSGYWSVTDDTTNPGYAWFVIFDDGYSLIFPETFGGYVRCVREA